MEATDRYGNVSRTVPAVPEMSPVSSITAMWISSFSAPILVAKGDVPVGPSNEPL